MFTDPPYFANVQYGELMDFCYVWLRRLAGSDTEGFEDASTRSPGELTGNTTQARNLDHFTDGITSAYRSMARALKPGAPLVFTFHYNTVDAYHAIGVAVLDSGLTCSATLPCPTEMRGSVHIHGTGSSIVDTVFVCRRHGSIRGYSSAATSGSATASTPCERGKLSSPAWTTSLRFGFRSSQAA